MNSKYHQEIVKTIKSALRFYDEYELNLPLTNFIFQSPLHWNVMTIIALATFDPNYTTSFQHLCELFHLKQALNLQYNQLLRMEYKKGLSKNSPT